MSQIYRRQMTLAQALKRAAQLYQQGQLGAAETLCQQILTAAPNNLQALNILGAVAMSSKDFERARQVYENALKAHGASPVLKNNLGSVLGKLGDLKKANSLFRQAIAAQPDYIDPYKNLANNYNEMGNHAKALAFIEKALAINPADVMALNIKTSALISSQQYEKAAELGLSIAARAPQDDKANYNCGYAHLELRKPLTAQSFLVKVSPHFPSYKHARNLLGRAYLDAHNLTEALRVLDNVLSKYPDFLAARLTRAKVLERLGRSEQALEEWQLAEHEDPENITILSSLGVLNTILGETMKAEAYFRKALDIAPNNVELLAACSANTSLTNDPALITKAKQLLARKSTSANDRVALHFFLAKADQSAKSYAQEFQHIETGNTLRKSYAKPYNHATQSDDFERIKSVYKAQVASLSAVPQTQELHPIFIIGMPRSGTTLTEQILSSHSRVFGAGELSEINRNVRPLIADENPDIGAASQLAETYQNYIDLVQLLTRDEPYIVDKMPHNFMYVGYILKTLPNAKFVNMNRDPRAVCWSIYKQNFASSGLNYAYDFEDIADFYRRYLDLIDFWKGELPGAIYDLNYEALTEAPEAETRKLLKYCDLPWQDACLEFHKNPRMVKTASHSQVRQPLYQGSSQSWRKYQDQLQPMLDALTAKSII